MLWTEVPPTYREALDSGFTTFEEEYNGIGGWNKVRSLFEKAVEHKSEALGIDYEFDPGTEDVLLSYGHSGQECYTAVLYDDVYGARRPLAKTPLNRYDSFRHDYTGTHKPDEMGVPGNPGIVDVDGKNLRLSSDHL